MTRTGQAAALAPAGGVGRQHGMTLIELMVAMTIGLFLIAGALTMYAQSKANYRTAETLARMQESVRFATDDLERDIMLAGFWGRHSSPGLVQVPADIRPTCRISGTDAADWALALSAPVAASDDLYDLPCPAFADRPRPGSDVLVLRHAGETRVAPEAGQIQVQADLATARVFDDGLPPLDPALPVRDVEVSAYYVNERSSFDDKLPSLRRLTLVRNGLLEDQEVIPGVENLQVQLGVDTDRDGNVDRYVDADHPLLAGEDPARVLAVRFWMLVRGETIETGYVDRGAYATPDADRGVILTGSDDYPANVRRLQLTRTVLVRKSAP